MVAKRGTVCPNDRAGACEAISKRFTVLSGSIAAEIIRISTTMLRTTAVIMIANVILLGEVDAAIRDGSRLRCSQIVRRVTDLFLVNAEDYSEQQIGLFDAVLVRLAAEIETSARALLAARLSPNARAPLGVIRMLALDDEIDVARSVLSQSVNRRPTLTPYRRPILTPLSDGFWW